MATICPTCGQSYPDRVGYCSNDGTKLVAQQAMATASGQFLDGKYQVREPIGEGLTGAVYRGFQLSVSRDVAVKLLRPAYTSDAHSRDLLFAAVQRASQLVRPTIALTIDAGVSIDAIYIVGELVRGYSLAQLLAPKKGLGARRAAAFAHQICDALAAAHAVGISHGDLKPGDVLVAPNDLVKVNDFGFTRALVRDPWSVEPQFAQYTAPELDAGVAPTVASDLYALGCIVHELVTGKPAFTATSARGIVEKHRIEPAPRLRDVPAGFASVVERLLAKDPHQRFATAAEALAALAPYVPNVAELALPAPVPVEYGREPSAPVYVASTTTSRTNPAGAYAPGMHAPSSPASSMARRTSSASRALVIASVAAVLALVGIAIYMFTSG